jgi:multiple sugar transport system permease protein
MVPSVSLLIPIYDIIMKIGLIGTYGAIILVYVVFVLPFSIWLMRGFFAEVPIEVEEAAAIDGCNKIGIFIRIVLPLSKPGIFANVIFTLMMLWGDFVFAGILGNKRTYTLPVIAAATEGKYGAEWGQLAALVVVITIPMLFFAIFAQKYLIKGLTMGAVKG